MLAYTISTCEVCIVWQKPTEAFKIHCQSPSRVLGSQQWSTVHDSTLWANIYVRSHLGWVNRLRFHPFLQVSQILQRRKSYANKQDFEINLNLTCQAQSIHKTIVILTKVFRTCGPHLVVLSNEWWVIAREGQSGVKFDLEFKFDLDGQGQIPSNTLAILTNRLQQVYII